MSRYTIGAILACIAAIALAVLVGPAVLHHFDVSDLDLSVARSSYWSAIAAMLQLFVSVVGIGLVIATLRQGQELAIAAHRPHLKMRRFSVVPPPADKEVGNSLVVRISAINWGQGYAKVINSHVATQVGARLPAMLDHWQMTYPWNNPFRETRQYNSDEMAETDKVAPGQTIEIDFPIELDAHQLKALRDGQLWIVGFITYGDTSAASRRQYHTDFARRYEDGRFINEATAAYESSP